MAYEFDEIVLAKDEGKDWWETIKRVPLKILDQDFGKEVLITDLVQPVADDKDSPSDDNENEAPEFDLDNLNRKADVVKESGYSKVNFHSDYFEAEIFSNQFDKEHLEARIEKGFLVISGCQKEKIEGDGTLWRQFDRRYMLPRDCHITDVKHQMSAVKFEGGINVRVYKSAEIERNRSPRRAFKKKSVSTEDLKITKEKEDSTSEKDTRSS